MDLQTKAWMSVIGGLIFGCVATGWGIYTIGRPSSEFSVPLGILCAGSGVFCFVMAARLGFLLKSQARPKEE